MRPLIIFYSLLVFCCIQTGIAKEQNTLLLRRYALVIGSNTGNEDRAALKYAVSDAVSFARVLTTMGGVSKSDLIVIKNPTVKTVTAGIQKLHNQVVKTKKSQERGETIIYYSGHADEHGIVLGTETLPYATFRQLINDIPVDVRIGVVDACASGSLTREKGGTRRPAFLFDVSAAMKGHAYLTSSSPDEAAQESDRIKGSFFTHYLISGMRGGADANSDGKVTLNEAYEFAFDETLRRTEKTKAGPQHAAYDIRLKGSGDLVMTDLRASSAGLRLSPTLSGRVFVRDTDGMLLAELNKMQGKAIELGLEPGEYAVTLEKPAQVLTSTVTLSEGKYTELMESRMDLVDRELTTQRGPAAIEGSPNDYSDYRRIPFNLSFLPSVSIGGTSDKLITNCSISLLAGYTSILRGVAISSGIHIAGEKAQGAQIAAGGNFTRGDVEGIQIAGGINTAQGNSECAQIAGGYNQAQDIKGIQITGGANVATGGMPGGAQIAGGYNSTAKNINGIQITGGLNIASDSSNCAQIAGGANKAQQIKGIQIAGGANIVSYNMPYGAQIAGGANITTDAFTGIQIAAGYNQVTGASHGMHIAGGMNLVTRGCIGGQIAGGVNLTSDQLKGIQIAGGANIANGSGKGVQIAGGCNIIQEIVGVQIGAVNVCRAIKGVQIGVVNISDSCTGIPIGVFSLIRSSPPHARVWTDEAGYVQSGIRSGSKYFYSLVTFGARPETGLVRWSIGYGLGGRIPVRRSFLSIEKLFVHSNEGRHWDRYQVIHTKDMLIAGFQFAPYFSIWGGPTLNMYWSTRETDKKLAYWNIESKQYRDYWYSIWPGFVIGFEF